MPLSKPTVLLACNFSERFKTLLGKRYRALGPMPSASPEALPVGAAGVSGPVTKGGLKTNRASNLDAFFAGREVPNPIDRF